MRYSIMLQLVLATTLILLGAAAVFAWVQNRPTSPYIDDDTLSSQGSVTLLA
jgi:hypothetical protein